jgi:hypothetical protein
MTFPPGNPEAGKKKGKTEEIYREKNFAVVQIILSAGTILVLNYTFIKFKGT